MIILADSCCILKTTFFLIMCHEQTLFPFFLISVSNNSVCDSLLKEVYVEDQRKPEWFEVDRAIACRRKSGCDTTCDILTTIQDNKDFQDYEFLVKWKGLDYS